MGTEGDLKLSLHLRLEVDLVGLDGGALDLLEQGVGLEGESLASLGLEAELAAPEEEAEAPAAPELEAGLAGLEVGAPDSLGLEAELAAPEAEAEAPAAPGLEDGLAGLGDGALYSLGLGVELAELGLEL